MLYKYNNGEKYLKKAGCSSSVDVEPEYLQARDRGQRSGCTNISVGTRPAYELRVSQMTTTGRCINVSIGEGPHMI